MNPEQQIVNLWLNSQGFFTVNDINAGKRVIDTIAVKQEASPRIQHVEVHCSVSGKIATPREHEELLKRFNDPEDVKSVNKNIKDLLGKKVDYEKVLVTTYTNIKIEGVKVLNFDRILVDVVSNLDMQNYRNSVIRSMQLLKYILMSHPDRMSELLERSDRNKIMTQSEKEKLAVRLLSQESAKKIFRKRKNEPLITDLLNISSLKSPERLATVLKEKLTLRSYNKLLKIMLKDAGIKKVIVPRKQEVLGAFMK